MTEEISLDAREVILHRCDGAIAISVMECGDKRGVMALIGASPAARVVAAFEISPKLTVTRGFDDLVDPHQELVVTRCDYGAMEREVPGFELLVRLSRVSSGEAAVDLFKVAWRRPGDDEAHRLSLDESTDRHDVGRPDVDVIKIPSLGLSRRPVGADEGSAPHLTGHLARRFKDRKSVTNRSSRHSELLGEPALVREAARSLSPNDLPFGQDPRRQSDCRLTWRRPGVLNTVDQFAGHLLLVDEIHTTNRTNVL